MVSGTYESLAGSLAWLPLPLTPPTRWRRGWCELWDHTSKSTLLVVHMLDYCLLLGFHFTPFSSLHFTPSLGILLRHNYAPPRCPPLSIPALPTPLGKLSNHRIGSFGSLGAVTARISRQCATDACALSLEDGRGGGRRGRRGHVGAPALSTHMARYGGGSAHRNCCHRAQCAA